MLIKEFSKNYSKAERLAQLEIASQKLPFFHILKFNLNTVGQKITKTIDNFTRDYKIVSAISQFKKSTISLNLNFQNLTDGFVPVRSICNLQGNNQHQLPLVSPINTNQKSQLNVTILNSEATIGFFDLVFLSEEAENIFSKDYSTKISEAKNFIEKSERTPYYASVDIPTDIALPNQSAPFTFTNDEHPRLLWALSSTYAYALFSLKTSWNNRSFSNGNADIPIWALAGNVNSNFFSSFAFENPIFVPPFGQISGNAMQHPTFTEKRGSLCFHLTTV